MSCVCKFVPGRPFDMAVFENVLWVSDLENRLIFRLEMRPGQNPERLLVDSIQPAAMVVVHPLAKPGTDAVFHYYPVIFVFSNV